MNDPNDYDEDTDQLLDTVLGTDVDESPARPDARFDGPIALAPYSADFLLDDVHSV
jgi:hypothetical protein